MSLFRPNIDRIAGYAPGEQPQESGWIKLNTNENPYPPSPRVVEAIQQAATGRLNLYPDPLATKFRQAAAQQFGVDADWILPANGSDENLTLLLRAFVDPGELVAYPYPSYILYETLADIQGGGHERLVLNPDWSWNFDACRDVIDRAKLVLVPNPNSPSGNRWPDEDILKLVPPRGLLVLDEAYGDFSDTPHRGEILKKAGAERIVITRSFSKSYSLAGVRLGFAIARPELIAGMQKVKDSYNCDTLSLAAGRTTRGCAETPRKSARHAPGCKTNCRKWDSPWCPASRTSSGRRMPRGRTRRFTSRSNSGGFSCGSCAFRKWRTRRKGC
jgi:histidinol-phosphate aminotransferase